MLKLRDKFTVTEGNKIAEIPILSWNWSTGTSTARDGFRTEYILEARIRVMFLANQAERERAMENALHKVQDHMYSEAVLRLRDIYELIKTDPGPACEAVLDLIKDMRSIA